MSTTVTKLSTTLGGNLYDVGIDGIYVLVRVDRGEALCYACGNVGCVHVDALRDMPYREQTDEGRQMEYRESLRREGNFQALEALDGRSI